MEKPLCPIGLLPPMESSIIIDRTRTENRYGKGTAMIKKNLLFLGGFGAPTIVFTPWFIVFRLLGYRVHVVPNNFFSVDPASDFARRFVELASDVDRFDAIGVSYGGNAALYGASLSPALCDKVDRMLLVCSPLLGIPEMVRPVGRILPGSLSRAVGEMAEDGRVTAGIRDKDFQESIDFDLHCIYHERDTMAPLEKATLPGVGTTHRLAFEWRCIPGLFMHQAAAINPETLKLIIRILEGE